MMVMERFMREPIGNLSMIPGLLFYPNKLGQLVGRRYLSQSQPDTEPAEEARQVP